MEVRFNDPNLFLSKAYKTMDKKEQVIIKYIPPQISS